MSDSNESHQQDSGHAPYQAALIAAQNKLFTQAEALWSQITQGVYAADAQYQLANLYLQGHGRDGSNQRALALLKSAAEQEHIFAQHQYAELIYAGERIPKNIEQAIYWWAQAANQSHPESQLRLGQLLLLGQEVPQDIRLAHQWLLHAVENNLQAAEPYLEQTTQLLQQEKTVTLDAASLEAHQRWLLEQDPQDYTLILHKTGSIEDAQAFIQQHNIAPVTHPILIHGQYVLLAGLFNTESAARTAITELTSDLQECQPQAIQFKALL